MTLRAHLQTGATTIARAWAVTRRDGVVLGFTDHDRDLAFDGIAFRARTALTASALQQLTGLGVDNAEASGALSDDALCEADILAGRFDGAEVRLWWVNWTDVTQRALKFRGWLGEIMRAGGAFRAELLGLSEPLGRPQGRVYQSGCSAVLGDAGCGVDLSVPGLSVERVPEAVLDGSRLLFDGLDDYAPGWFTRGWMAVPAGEQAGPAAGLGGLIRTDRRRDGLREIGLWERLAAPLAAGVAVRLSAGCDKRPETCRGKFDNFLNFRGFPHIPGEDWMMAVPREGGLNNGGSWKR